jgi:2-C-methyl-D-erythritol 4-phosphate cytidylyltransferase
MKSDTPKQFMLLAGKPVLMHTIERFREAIPGINIVVVLAGNLNDQWRELCKEYRFTVPHQLADGGSTRFHSVRNGLAIIPPGCLVGVHDAARPLVSVKTILSAFATAGQKGNACPFVPVFDSLRKVDGENNVAVDRNSFRIIQTPQCFQSSLLKQAFLQDYSDQFTDDASVLEALGEKINLVEGNAENIKITTAKDLIIAEALLPSLK